MAIRLHYLHSNDNSAAKRDSVAVQKY